MELRTLLKGRGAFFKNVLTISTGAISGQLIALLIAPFLTRLYTPEQFGILALFLSFSSILSNFASLRYEFTIMLPKSIGEQLKLGKLTLIVGFISCVISALIFYFFQGSILAAFEASTYKYWLLLVPVGAFLTLGYQTFSYLNNSQKMYGKIGLSKFIDSTTNNLTKLGLGLLIPSHWGLIAGYLVGKFCAIVQLSGVVNRMKRQINKTVSLLPYTQLAKKYQDFPLKSAPAALLSVISYHTPVLLLGYLFNKELLGFYSLTDKLLYAPTIFLGTAIGQVFFQRASEQAGTDKMRVLVRKITIYLTLLSIPIVMVLMFFGPTLFAFFFGKNWNTAGQIASILAPLYFSRLVVSSQTHLLTVLRKLHIELWIYGLQMLARGLSIIIGYYNDSFQLAFVLMSVSGTVLYLLLLTFIFYYSKSQIEISDQNPDDSII